MGKKAGLADDEDKLWPSGSQTYLTRKIADELNTSRIVIKFLDFQTHLGRSIWELIIIKTLKT